jgi:hypothetical protein
VIGGGIYLYRTNPSSKLLDAQVIGPVLVAAFGWLTTFLAFWLDPRGDNEQPTGGKAPRRRMRRR